MGSLWSFQMGRQEMRLDTVELVALFASEPDFVTLDMELEWIYSTDASPVPIRQTSKPIPALISNDYIRETDGLPVNAIDLKATKLESEDGLSNEKWMTPLRTRQAIEGFVVGGGVDAVVEAAVLELRADEAQAAGGALNDVLMTPLRTKQAIETFVGSGGGGGVGLVIDAGTL